MSRYLHSARRVLICGVIAAVQSSIAQLCSDRPCTSRIRIRLHSQRGSTCTTSTIVSCVPKIPPKKDYVLEQTPHGVKQPSRIRAVDSTLSAHQIAVFPRSG